MGSVKITDKKRQVQILLDKIGFRWISFLQDFFVAKIRSYLKFSLSVSIRNINGKNINVNEQEQFFYFVSFGILYFLDGFQPND